MRASLRLLLVAISCFVCIFQIDAFVGLRHHALLQNYYNQRFMLPPTRCTHLLAASVSPSEEKRDHPNEPNALESLLKHNGYTRLLVTVSTNELPVLGEIYDRGKWELCLVTAFRPTAKGTASTPPLVEIQLVSNKEEKRVVDFGQITTVWNNTVPSDLAESFESWRTQMENEIDKFPVQHGDQAMQRLYQSLTQQKQGQSSEILSKKQISQLSSRIPDKDLSQQLDSVLRKLIKTGPGMSRLANSAMAMDYLYKDYPSSNFDALRKQTVGAHILERDANLGGRFKRLSCTFVSVRNEDESNHITCVTFVNGGWLALDQSVRAETEARKFAQRVDNSNESEGPKLDRAQLMTAADERIAQRLECFAMGEIFSWGGSINREQEEDERNLEQDVRKALKALGLPLTPEGAQEALLLIGRWTQKPDQVRLEPWTQDALEAAHWFSQINQRRQQQLYENCGVENEPDDLEKRIDLTSLPCICVDAKRTSFRDDALGVRPRSNTGRKIVKDASKWEILIHITDTSDIYSPEPYAVENKEKLQVLRNAATNRGTSRYDLPLGPLHLMPPVALEALSFDVKKVDITNLNNTGGSNRRSVNRCVTLWVYIDERSGKVIDSGLERTLISTPIALSYEDASALLDGSLADTNILKGPKAVLSVAERNLMLWSAQHRQRNASARKREERLAAREIVAKETQGGKLRDDGRAGFQRTRSHKIVDAALDIYGIGISSLLTRANAPIPRASGSGMNRGGRVASAPLRRYIDGMAQRQALSVLCQYGGPPLTKSECDEANRLADKANNAISNLSSLNNVGGKSGNNQSRQQEALRLLEADLSGKRRSIPAMSTGRENEVTIMGVGAVAKCRGVNGTLKPGEQVMVQVRKLDAEKGILSVSLAQDRICK